MNPVTFVDLPTTIHHNGLTCADLEEANEILNEIFCARSSAFWANAQMHESP
jgi:hypothetical protein